MKQGDTIDRNMTQEERIDALRFDFQERVGKHSVTPWTITEEEARQMLAGNSIAVLLRAFASTGLALKTKRDAELVFLPEEEVLNLLRVHVARQRQKEHRKVARGAAA